MRETGGCRERDSFIEERRKGASAVVLIQASWEKVEEVKLKHLQPSTPNTCTQNKNNGTRASFFFSCNVGLRMLSLLLLPQSYIKWCVKYFVYIFFLLADINARDDRTERSGDRLKKSPTAASKIRELINRLIPALS